MATKRHIWSKGDDIVAFYISRHGTRALPLMIAGIAKRLGMSEDSLIMRQGNFAHIERGSGLSNAARQSRVIYERYKGTPEAELRAIVIRFLESKRTGTLQAAD